MPELPHRTATRRNTHLAYHGRANRALRTMQALALAVTVVATAAGCFDPTKTVRVTLVVEAPYGGVFPNNDNCDVNAEFLPVIGDIQVQSKESGPTKALPPINWERVGEKTCSATIDVQLNPEEIYTVDFAGIPAGTVNKTAMDLGESLITKEIRATRQLNGRIRLYQQASYAAEYPSGLTLKGFSSGGENFTSLVSNVSCEGKGAYRLLSDRTSIEITDKLGNLLFSGNLREGSLDNIVIDELTTYCDFSFNFDAVPFSEDGYILKWGIAPDQSVSLGSENQFSIEIDIAYPKKPARSVSPNYCALRVGAEWDYTPPKVCWAP